MTHTPFRPLLPRLLGIVLLCCAGFAQAQFVWIAPNGTRQYSDQPPPPGTPASKILKAPGRVVPLTAEPAVEVRPKPMTTADREADYRKRAGEREAAQRKSEAAAQQAAVQKDFCDGTRKVKKMYDSGIRIADVGEDGQRRFLSDGERADRVANMNKALRDCQ